MHHALCTMPLQLMLLMSSNMYAHFGEINVNSLQSSKQSFLMYAGFTCNAFICTLKKEKSIIFTKCRKCYNAIFDLLISSYYFVVQSWLALSCMCLTLLKIGRMVVHFIVICCFGICLNRSVEFRCSATQLFSAGEFRCSATQLFSAGEFRCSATQLFSAGEFRCSATQLFSAGEFRCSATQLFSAGELFISDIFRVT